MILNLMLFTSRIYSFMAKKKYEEKLVTLHFKEKSKEKSLTFGCS